MVHGRVVIEVAHVHHSRFDASLRGTDQLDLFRTRQQGARSTSWPDMTCSGPRSEDVKQSTSSASTTAAAPTNSATSKSAGARYTLVRHAHLREGPVTYDRHLIGQRQASDWSWVTSRAVVRAACLDEFDVFTRAPRPARRAVPCPALPRGH